MDNQQTQTKQNSHAARRKYHIIYKTICTVTNKFYFGMHSTDNLEDGYIGSGQVLWRSIKKYGKEAHVCEIVEYLPTREELSNREREILTEELRKDPMCMNIMTGGIGNYPGTPTSEETKRKISEAMRGREITWADKISNAHVGKKIPKEISEKTRLKNLGRVQSDEEKKMRSDVVKDKAAYNSKPVIVDGIEYCDVQKAATAIGMSASTLGKQCSSIYFFDRYYKGFPKEKIEKIPSGSIAVIIDGKEYINKSVAARELGMSVKMIYGRCKSEKYPNYQFNE